MSPSPGTADTWADPKVRNERELARWAEIRVQFESADNDGKVRIQAEEHYTRIGPFIRYDDGRVCLRRTGQLLWKPGDPPEHEPKNPEPAPYDRPHTTRRF